MDIILATVISLSFSHDLAYLILFVSDIRSLRLHLVGNIPKHANAIKLYNDLRYILCMYVYIYTYRITRASLKKLSPGPFQIGVLHLVPSCSDVSSP